MITSCLPALSRCGLFRMARVSALAIAIAGAGLASQPVLAQGAPSTKIARDLTDVVNGAPVNRLSWAKDFQGTRMVKAIIVAVPAADPDLSSLRAAVLAAGNFGQAANGAERYGSIGSPGHDPSVITVGSANTKATAARSDDSVNFFSSRGPTRGGFTDAAGLRRPDNLLKPDLLAPGNKIVGVLAASGSESWAMAGLPKDYPQLTWAGNKAKWRTVSYWPAASGVPANTFVKSVLEGKAANQPVLSAGVVSANGLLGTSSLLGRTGVFLPTATLSSWLASGSGSVLSEGFVLSGGGLC